MTRKHSSHRPVDSSPNVTVKRRRLHSRLKRNLMCCLYRRGLPFISEREVVAAAAAAAEARSLVVAFRRSRYEHTEWRLRVHGA